MSTTYDGFPPETTAAQDDAPMFAATPVWDRKRKGLGPRRAPPASTLDSDDVVSTPVGAAPASRTSVRKRSSAVPAVIGATAVSLIALGAAGWWMGRDTGGVPELSPGPATASAPPDTAPRMAAAEPAAAPAEVPYTAAEPAAPRAATAPPARRMAAAPRVRPAASAATRGTDASATLPDGPQPYSAMSPQASSPAPAAEAAPIPATPPSQAPSVTAEPAPTTTVPQDAPTN